MEVIIFWQNVDGKNLDVLKKKQPEVEKMRVSYWTWVIMANQLLNSSELLDYIV